MTRAEDGEVRLAWPRIVWGLAILATLIGGWYDLRYQVKSVLNVVELHERRIAVLEARGTATPDIREMLDDISAEIRANRKLIREGK